ncbi:type VI secretion system protein TssA [Longibacter sp.]|uniref:type VI secretion system protein TssA n=1 Tax=Longibacter sp. TaxID=2045415 RepID=UPI003EBF7A76
MAETTTDSPNLDTQVQETQELIRAPISDDAPTGSDITYDDSYQELKNIVDDLSTAAGEVDVEALASKSLDVLTELSKDVRVASYFVVGKSHTHGMDGVAIGLAGLNALFDAHWENMYPPARRARARSNALQFVADHLSPWIKRQTFTTSDAEAVRQAIKHGRAVQTLAMDRLGDQAPALSGFLSEFERVDRRLTQRLESQAEETEVSRSESTETEESTTSPSSPSASSSNGSPAASSLEIPSEGEEFGDEDARRIITDVASRRRSIDLTNPEPYALLRVVRWGSLQSVPPNSSGETQIRAPEEAQRSALASLFDRKAFEKLLDAGETTFQSGPAHYWLDLQRMQVQAARQLGGRFTDVADAIQHHTVGLIERFPELPNLSYRDGTPFADPTTLGWLDSLAPSSDASTADVSGGADPLADVLADARQKMQSGSLEEALHGLTEMSAPDGRTRFRRQLEIASLCLDGGHPEVALPLLEQLHADIERHALDQWEPDLALRTWTTLHTCYTRTDELPASEVAQARRVYGRICELAPSKALTLQPIAGAEGSS